MACQIERCSVDDLMAAPNWPALVAEYVAESANPDLGDAMMAGDLYLQLEAAGVLVPFAAHVDGALIGFADLLVTPSPHYGGRMTGQLEAIFVASEHRHTGAGLMLIDAAESTARQLEVAAMIATAPVSGRLATVLRRRGYRDANILMTKHV